MAPWSTLSWITSGSRNNMCLISIYFYVFHYFDEKSYFIYMSVKIFLDLGNWIVKINTYGKIPFYQEAEKRSMVKLKSAAVQCLNSCITFENLLLRLFGLFFINKPRMVIGSSLPNIGFLLPSILVFFTIAFLAASDPCLLKRN